MTFYSNKAEKEAERAERLERDNQRLREQMVALESQLKRENSTTQIINDLKEQLVILGDENNSLNTRLQKLRKKDNAVFESTNTEQSDFNVADDFFLDKRIVIVGGRWEVHRRLEELMPKVKIINSETDPMVDLLLYDVVIFFTDFINHPNYFKFVKKCRVHNVPTLYMQGSNLEKIKNDIYSFYAEQLMTE